MSVAGVVSGIYGTAFQISPIWLTGGLSSSLGVSGSLGFGFQLGLPLSLLTEISALDPLGLALQGFPKQAFANYRPLPGSTLVKYQVAEYPFYNQQIAANASIKQPNSISMLMYCPATGTANVAHKTAIMSALKWTLDNHIQQGGTFTVATPSYIYTDCLMTGMTDVSTEQTNQAQWAYQMDFTQPLLTFEGAPGTLNSILGGMIGGTP